MQTNIISSKAAISTFISQTYEQSQFSLEPVPLNSQSQWAYRDGALTHKSGGFFQVVGLLNNQQEELALFQPQSALAALLLTKHEDEIYILLQARAEPGNVNTVQLGPTIQSTMANYMRQHGGKATPFLEYFLAYQENATPLWHSEQMDLGKSYYQKTKRLQYVFVDDFLPTPLAMAWVSLSALATCLRDDNIVNPDLRALLAGFDWASLKAPVAKSPTEKALLKAQLLPDIAYDGRYHNTRLKSLNQLKSFTQTEKGWEPKDGAGASIKMYKINLATREVAHWYQPLLTADSRGKVYQVIRKTNGKLEFLVTWGKEIGAVTQPALLPTATHYPGEKHDPFAKQASGLKECFRFAQCDEGGRFFGFDSDYICLEANKQMALEKNQQWMDLEDLKLLFSLPNMTSITLRMMMAAFFYELNPSLAQKESLVEG